LKSLIKELLGYQKEVVKNAIAELKCG